METLWTPFNKISPTAWSMSQYYQQEILDDHMRDSNWKKWLELHKCAVKGISDTKFPFNELTHSLDPEKIAIWEKDKKMAMEVRGEYLDIYQLKIGKKSETSDIERPGSVPWIIQGINLEDSQNGLRSDVQGIELDWSTVHVDDPRFCMAEANEQAWEVSDEDDSELIDEEIPAEDMIIWMPSSVTHDYTDVLGLAKLQEEELALRKGQTNDCLENIQLALGQKAVIYC
ncbi:hypothetical protein EV424DRAFT_1347050 [Suillus variegatus]|nr:hypothetical protein EV424DRAFT_1347050 [Suillus variegatus]